MGANSKMKISCYAYFTREYAARINSSHERLSLLCITRFRSIVTGWPYRFSWGPGNYFDESFEKLIMFFQVTGNVVILNESKSGGYV